MYSLKSFFSFFDRIFYPSVCPVCKKSSSPPHEPFCSVCWNSIVPYNSSRCDICGLPLPEDTGICGECLRKKPYFNKVIFFGLYHGILKEAIHYFKYNGRRGLSRPMGEFFLRMDIPRADMIVPVPLHHKRLKQRGFNHASILAKRLSEIKCVPLNLNLLMKMRETPAQVSLKREDRLKNLRNAFVVTEKLSGEKVILIDDVLTTGATASECSKVLLNAGALEVKVVVLARSGIDIFPSENVT